MTYVPNVSFLIFFKKIEDNLGATNKCYLILHNVDCLHSDNSNVEKAGSFSRMKDKIKRRSQGQCRGAGSPRVCLSL